jgi:putative endonuclease
VPDDALSRPPVRSQANRARGAYGERRAAEWYVSHGYVVLDRNWRSGRLGELDLVLGLGQIVVFCEVKARASNAYGSGAEAVTPTKQRRLRQLAAAWLAAHDHQRARARFDVVSVTGTAVEVYEDAF